jgi:hypothetical protein
MLSCNAGLKGSTGAVYLRDTSVGLLARQRMSQRGQRVWRPACIGPWLPISTGMFIPSIRRTCDEVHARVPYDPKVAWLAIG